MGTDVLGIGLSGKSLTPLERRILSDTSPYAIVLFGRNIGSVEQLQDLVREVKAISKTPPLIMIDEEGGRVDRLRNIVPGFPSAESFAEGEKPEEMSEWLGRVIGMTLRYFDIEIDLAPVVDIRGEKATKGLERRTFGKDPETVVQLAGVHRGCGDRLVAASPALRAEAGDRSPRRALGLLASCAFAHGSASGPGRRRTARSGGGGPGLTAAL